MIVDELGFNNEFNRSLARLRNETGATVELEQDRLRTLIPTLDTERQRQWAAEMIAKLPQASRPRQRSRLYEQALEIQATAFHGGGSDEDYLANIVTARQRIQALAEHAPADERVSILALTRMLEHMEDRTRNPPWDAPRATESS